MQGKSIEADILCKFQLLQCQSDELMPKSGDSYLLATIRHFTTCIHESENGHIFIMLGVEIWEQKRKTARYTFENVHKSLQPFSTSQLLIKLSPFPINSCCGLACIIVWLFCFRCEQHQNNFVVKDRETLGGTPPPSPFPSFSRLTSAQLSWGRISYYKSHKQTTQKTLSTQAYVFIIPEVS